MSDQTPAEPRNMPIPIQPIPPPNPPRGRIALVYAGIGLGLLAMALSLAGQALGAAVVLVAAQGFLSWYLAAMPIPGPLLPPPPPPPGGLQLLTAAIVLFGAGLLAFGLAAPVGFAAAVALGILAAGAYALGAGRAMPTNVSSAGGREA